MPRSQRRETQAWHTARAPIHAVIWRAIQNDCLRCRRTLRTRLRYGGRPCLTRRQAVEASGGGGTEAAEPGRAV